MDKKVYENVAKSITITNSSPAPPQAGIQPAGTSLRHNLLSGPPGKRAYILCALTV